MLVYITVRTGTGSWRVAAFQSACMKASICVTLHQKKGTKTTILPRSMWRCWENSMVAISLKASFIGPMVKSRTRRDVPRAKCVMRLYMRCKSYLEDGWKVKTVVFGPYSSSNIYQVHHLSTITTLNIAKPPILHVSPPSTPDMPVTRGLLLKTYISEPHTFANEIIY